MTPETLVQEEKSQKASDEELVIALFEPRLYHTADHQALYSRKDHKEGEVLCKFSAAARADNPTYLSVQVGLSEHIFLFPKCLELINHSCDPNVFFDISASVLRALKDISEGDQLSFFYPSTEWSMSQPFECWCGSPDCLKTIQGAAFLPQSVLQKYEINNHIRILARDNTPKLT